MKKNFAIIILIMILSLTLTACNRSLSTPPAEVPPTAEPASEDPFPIEEPTAAPKDPATDPLAPTGIAPTTLPTVDILIPTTTPLPTPVPVIIDTPVVPVSYVLQQGEFPYCLARRFNVDPNTLLSTNGLGQNSWVSPGTILSIPTGSTWSGAPRERMPHPTTYTVKSGDTIYSIACAFGDVFPESIAQANAMQAPYALTVGQTLQIP
ncbi:MAG: LysM peptidoglycan-binding domain-containing protein [Anaerolineaceae bacterium]|jgi:LysM repeat protein/predicted small lipoprotein YifL|nr:LysM peptidoglycan-binding domain-containing protein [Anaerolineaceae bacterium]